MSRRVAHPLVPLAFVALAAIACSDTPKQPATKSAKAADAAIAASVCRAAPAPGSTPAVLDDWSRGAVLFDDVGTFRRAATTRSPDAQRWFDQGMRFLWAFNHDEATRAFVKAATFDPDCAACWWGASLALGPNYNFPLMPDRAQAAWDALGRARKAAATASPVERALIDALGRRYGGP